MKRVLAALLLVIATLVATSASAQVRAIVGHFAPFADTLEGTQVDIAVNGTTALEDVQYGTFTPDYVDLGPAGDYTVEIFPEGSSTAAITFTGNLSEGDFTLLAVGDGVNQDLGLLALTDDNTSPGAANVRVRVVHAAPFASTPATTAVSVRTDGGDVVGDISSLSFGESTDYLELPAALYDLKVASPDGSANFIDLAPITVPATAILTVIATGDGTNQPLGFTALPVGPLGTENPTDQTAAGLFFDPNTAGQGAQVVVFPREDRVVGFFYTFAADGSGQQWFNFDSCNADPGGPCETPGAFDGITGLVTVYESTGGAFNDGSVPVTLTATGIGIVTMLDCDTLEFIGDIGNGAGEITLTYTRLGDRFACSPALAP